MAIVETKYKLWIVIERHDIHDDGEESWSDIEGATASVGEFSELPNAIAHMEWLSGLYG